jgi:two-component system sensor kinase FixL
MKQVHIEDELLWKADGTSFPAECWYHPQLRAGRVVGAVAAFIDITQRKQAEAQAAALRDELVHLGRVTMLEALSGSLAHEINQPLTAVMANSEAALRLMTMQPPPMSELRDVLHDIRSDNRRAGDVVQRMRTLLKKSTTQYEPIEINSTALDVVKLINNRAKARGIAIEVDLAPRADTIVGDRVQLQQVILNLLMNACDAVQEQDSTLRHVVLKTEHREHEAVVEVRDQGPGLADAELAVVFEPFYTTKRDGMGLGLSICRAIVNAHGGSLGAARNPDRGMTFTATFPFRTTPPNPRKGAAVRNQAV